MILSVSIERKSSMFSYISKKLRFSKLKKENDKKNGSSIDVNPILSVLDDNVKNIREILCNSEDIIFCEFSLGHNIKKKGLLIYVDGMTDRNMLQINVLQPLMDNIKPSEIKGISMEKLKKNIITISDTIVIDNIDNLVDNLLSGSTIMIVDGLDKALVINAIKLEQRSISEPETENVVRGPREGFTENIHVNTTLLRRKIKDPSFCIESIKLGDKTNTTVSLAYLKNVAEAELIREVKTRLNKINIDAVLDSGYVEQFIEDNPSSIYPTIGNSEKPDVIAAKILEGRVAILVDGTPFILTVPMLFVESFQVSEDYYSRTLLSSFIRLLRFLSYTISVLSPAIYVALTVFHQELIPTQLLISIASGREPVPFPAVIEASIMIITFDILREAGVRLPKPVGSAISIVGALVLGQSAVAAGLISPIMVIVVASTAIASFVVPAQTDSGTILRYIYLIFAGFAGGFGIIMGLLVNLIYITSIKSFGVPYFSPIAPLILSDLKDTFIRMPLWTILNKPKALSEKYSDNSDSKAAVNKKRG